jgi:ribosomal protein L24E
MSPSTCDHCGTPFDPAEWHPAAVSDSDGALHEFCSENCKRAFLETTTVSGEDSQRANGADTD